MALYYVLATGLRTDSRSMWRNLQVLAKAKKHDEYAFQWSNPNRSLGEKTVVSVDPAKAADTVHRHQNNGQPVYGDDDFFNSY